MSYRLERTTFLPRAPEEVFAFFADTGNVQKITPPFLHFHILTPPPIAMRPGTLIHYRLQLFGVPILWRTRIETFEPITHFVDIQLSGPYRLWHHRHDFEAVPGGTRMRDRVDYDLPFGILGSVARVVFVCRTLDRIFDYRTSAIERIFSKPNHGPSQARMTLF
jgi:ligand-binding SRPBCC domain-containing protein